MTESERLGVPECYKPAGKNREQTTQNRIFYAGRTCKYKGHASHFTCTEK